MLFQQGDVLIEACKEFPSGLTQSDSNHLAEGEVTGHFHKAVGEGVAVLEGDGEVYLDTPCGCDIVHQEHNCISVPSGRFEVRKVQEYDHFKEEARAVVD